MNSKFEPQGFKWEDLCTIPNILTYLRLLLISPFIMFFIEGKYINATICILISGLSDCFDGLVARKFNQVTELGKILDPIADKLTLLSVMFCMLIYVPSILPIILILILKDILMLFGGLFLIRRKIDPPTSKWFGKLATVSFYFSVTLIIFLKATFLYENIILDTVLLTVTAFTMLYALYRYLKIFLVLVKKYNYNINISKNIER